MKKINACRKAESRQKRERKVNLRNIFYHNTFVLVFSILAAVVIWFFMKAGSDGAPM